MRNVLMIAAAMVVALIPFAATGGTSTEPRVTVASEQHYQKQIFLNCTNGECSKDLAPVATDRRLHIRSISCIAIPLAGTFFIGTFSVENAADEQLAAQVLTPVYINDNGYLYFHQALDLVVKSGQHGQAYIAVAGGGTPNLQSAVCTLTGILQKLA